MGGSGATGSTGSATGGGSGGAGASGSTTGTGSGAGVPGAWCKPIPACDAPPPDPGPESEWKHSFTSPIVVASGPPNHRGRDLFLNPGDPQWIIGKISYGYTDKDLVDEEVDVWLLRGCGATWELLGTATTTDDEEHATVEGVDDSGGRVYFEIPADKLLDLGRHRIHLVVKGDLTTTDLFVEIVPKGTPVFVSDVDGTLTTSENAEYGALLTGSLPDVHPHAAQAFSILAAKGYHPMYLTARPEFLVGRTRELLDVNAFPPGVLHTTVTLTGALGSVAVDYKTGELAMLAGKGMVPTYVFGNTDSDAAAYENAGIQPLDHRVFYQFDDAMYGGRRIESYDELFAELDALPDLCGD
jgi:hypothetical protein